MSILKFIFIFLEVLLLFNLLIFVHELGHFLAARWRGLKVDRFAIWFGKPIWKAKINGVEYALGTIPAGGYVSLPQMATMEVIEGKGESSGHVQRVVELRVDCDQDALWLKVEQQGPGACHTGRRSCFYRAVPLGKSGASLQFREEERAFDPDKVYGKK